MTAFRRKNALHAIHDKTPKLKPVDLSPQTKQGWNGRVADALIVTVFLVHYMKGKLSKKRIKWFYHITLVQPTDNNFFKRISDYLKKEKAIFINIY